jgi:hypothetical protein
MDPATYLNPWVAWDASPYASTPHPPRLPESLPPRLRGSGKVIANERQQSLS